MASLFNRDPGPERPLGPYAPERIEGEIAHLRHRESVRFTGGKGKGKGSRDRTTERRAGWMAGLLVIALLSLYFLDLPLHAYFRGEAVRDYLYLHHYGSDRKATELVDTGIFSAEELELLDRRAGSFQGYYAGPLEASRAADTIIGYLRGVNALQQGEYDKLGPVNKIRYQLFVRFGFLPPTHWSRLDPIIDH